jgi:hypothetical protein
MESTSPMQLTDWLLVVLAILFIGQTQISLTKSGFNHFCNGNTSLGRLSLHCTENPIYMFLEMKLRGLVSNSYIHCICERFIFSQDRSTYCGCSKIGRLILGIYKLLTDT